VPSVKPRPHQQQCRSNWQLCLSVACCFNIVVCCWCGRGLRIVGYEVAVTRYRKSKIAELTYVTWKRTGWELNLNVVILCTATGGYCDHRVCMSVCLCVRSHNSKTACRNFMKFSVLVIYGCGSVLFWRQYNVLCTSYYVDDVIFST